MTNAIAGRACGHEPEWFEAWFDSPHYHQLYVHRDTAEAVTLVDRLIDRLQPAPGARVLDLGCGAGRHSRALAARGFDVTGLDLSAQSLARARRSETPNLLVESASHQVSGANWTMCSFPFSSMT